MSVIGCLHSPALDMVKTIDNRILISRHRTPDSLQHA